MKPSRDDDAVVDLLDVVLRDGIVVEADVIITVADVALVGITLRAALAGMTTMARYGLLDERADGISPGSTTAQEATIESDAASGR